MINFKSISICATRHPGRDSLRAILPEALRVNANPFQTDLCRDPEAMDGNVQAGGKSCIAGIA